MRFARRIPRGIDPQQRRAAHAGRPLVYHVGTVLHQALRCGGLVQSFPAGTVIDEED